MNPSCSPGVVYAFSTRLGVLMHLASWTEQFPGSQTLLVRDNYCCTVPIVLCKLIWETEYIYVYTCIHIYTNIYMCVYIHKYTYMYTYVYIFNISVKPKYWSILKNIGVPYFVLQATQINSSCKINNHIHLIYPILLMFWIDSIIIDDNVYQGTILKLPSIRISRNVYFIYLFYIFIYFQLHYYFLGKMIYEWKFLTYPTINQL